MMGQRERGCYTQQASSFLPAQQLLLLKTLILIFKTLQETTSIMSGRFFRSADSDSDSDSSSEEEEVMSSDEEGSQAADSKPQKTAKQSRFLKDDGDDSDDDSDDDDDDDSDDEDAAKPAAGAKPGMSRFMRGASDDSDSDDDDVKKVIKSAKDKRFDEVDAVIKNIENAQRIGDWVAIAKGEYPQQKEAKVKKGCKMWKDEDRRAFCYGHRAQTFRKSYAFNWEWTALLLSWSLDTEQPSSSSPPLSQTTMLSYVLSSVNVMSMNQFHLLSSNCYLPWRNTLTNLSQRRRTQRRR